MNPSTAGAFGELLVSADLLKRGYHVYRALSPAAPCDLLIFKDSEQPLRVEVRMGQIHKNTGMLTFSLVLQKDSGRADLFAIVVDESINYYPPGIVAPTFPLDYLLSGGKRAALESALRQSQPSRPATAVASAA